jgi:DNA primase catalytic core
MSAIPFAEASERIKSGLDIVEVVQRHMVLKKSGRNYMGKCPFHNDKSPSMNVNREKGIFKCFACGVGGDAFTFLMKLENRSFGELIRDLAEERGIEIQRDDRFGGTADAEQFIQRKAVKERLQQLIQASGQWFRQQLALADAASPVQQALSDRYPEEIDRELILERFHLGFAPSGWDNLSTQMKRQFDFVQANPNLLMDAGLASVRESGQGHYDRFRNRLIIPIHDEQNRLIAFGARVLSADDNPKYLNSPETALYKKNQVLYGLGQAKESIRQTRCAVVMEGYFDVISAHLAGITEAVGSCGTALTEQHLKLLTRFGAEKIILAFDSDEAGLKASLSAIELMTPYLENIGHGPELSVQVLTVPSGKDPDGYIREHGGQAFRELMGQAQAHWRFRCELAIRGSEPSKSEASKQNDISDAEARLQAVSRLTPVLSAIARPTVREEAIHSYAARLGVSHEALALEVKRFEQSHTPRSGASTRSFSGEFQKKAILETHLTSNSVTQSISPPLSLSQASSRSSASQPQPGVNTQQLIPTPWRLHQYSAEKALLHLLLAIPEKLPFMLALLKKIDANTLFIDEQHRYILDGFLGNAPEDNTQKNEKEGTDSFPQDIDTMLTTLNAQTADRPDLLNTFTDLLLSADAYAESLDLQALQGEALDARLQSLVQEQIGKLHNCQRGMRLLALRGEAAENEESDIIQTYAFHDQYNKIKLPHLGAG